ncbi:hypothetical protein ABT282_28920 [Streptomyces sp. NPDC000927]
MTLDELEEAIQHARKAGAEGTCYVYAVLSTSGKIKEVGVNVGDGADY